MTEATIQLLIGDAMTQVRTLPQASIDTCITSPPFWGLRHYLPRTHPHKNVELGQEATPQEYITRLVAVFREVKRVLRPEGTLWVNIGDAYAGSGRGAWAHPSAAVKETYVPQPGATRHLRPDRPPKNLLMLPARFALAMQDDGWILRSDIIWHKPNGLPSSVKDRPTSSYEHIFLFSQQPQYYYDARAIAEPAVVGDNGSYFDRGKTGETHANQGKDRREKSVPSTRNKRDVWREEVADNEIPAVWSVSTAAYRGAHFAVWPQKLVEIMIVAGCPSGGTVLDPFAGSGTTLAVANRLGRHAVGIELNPDYAPLIAERCAQGSWVLPL